MARARKQRGGPPDRAGAPAADDVPVVGIGASAGGIEALREFLEPLPADIRLAIVVVLHQPADAPSSLSEVVGRFTERAVALVTDGVRPEAGTVHLRPPGAGVVLRAGRLRLVAPLMPDTVPRPIDLFFRSLADDRGEHAIAVVLSGTGSDGAAGVRAVKGAGGAVFAQDPATTRFGSMPDAARATGLVDFTDSPGGLAGRLVEYLRGPYLTAAAPEPEAPPGEVARALDDILDLLRARVGNDFGRYKVNTIRRRIERRMAVHHLRSLREYSQLLRRQPAELDTLFHELLIGVTSFFRDPDAFAALAGALPEMLGGRPAGAPVRAWVPGCSTGEEAYSIAIVLREALEAAGGPQPTVQVFATDLDDDAIRTARAGAYPSSVAGDVGVERLRRYFVATDDTLQVRRELRDLLVFATQNVITDPPFIHVDLISCRNLLIYFEKSLQDRLLPLLHYALRPGGLLLLGSSESLGDARDLFDVVDKRWKLFRRREGVPAGRALPPIPAALARAGEGRKGARGTSEMVKDRDLEAALFERALLQSYLPPSVVLRDDGEVVYFHGRTGAFLEPAPGHARNNALDMAREGLREPLAAALRQAAGRKGAVIRHKVRVRTNGEHTFVHLVVRQMTEPDAVRGLLLATFEPADERPAAEAFEAGDPARRDERITDLERELHYASESLQSTVEELETANEELKAALEEYQSTNEELESTNEELETSKEELQSLNEELHTVNQELEVKVEALSRAHDDMANLLNSIDVATLFLDNDLKIKRFTTQTKKVVKLIEGDVGRFVSDFACELKDLDLSEVAGEVLRTLIFREREVQARDGSWYLMRAMPYRTARNVIDGVLLTFVDITRYKATEDLLAFVDALIGATGRPALLLDAHDRVALANAPFREAFGLTGEEATGQRLSELAGGRWDLPAVRALIEAARAGDPANHHATASVEVLAGHQKNVNLTSRRLRLRSGQPELVALVIDEGDRHGRGGVGS
jgi:two-component system CheB/CheR fusion protein